MKKLVSLLLLAALCLTLCACSAFNRPLPTPAPKAEPTAAPTPEPTAEPTPAPAPTPEAAAPSGPVLVSVSRTELTAMDPQKGERCILRFSYDTPVVDIEGRPEAAAKISEYLALLSEAYYTGENYGDGYGTGYNNMLTMAEDNYNYFVETGAAGPDYEMTADRRALILRNDGRVLSLLFNDYSYTGGAHGGMISRAFCFDSETGALLTVDSLSRDESFRKALADELIRQARSQYELREQMDLTPDEELDAALSNLVREGSWYIDYSGLVFFSDDYELSSHASGPVSIRIPYSDVSSWLDPRYIPAAGAAEGRLSVVRAEELAGGSVPIVDMVKLHENGETFCLAAEGALQEVSLASVEYSGAFFETAQLWSCSELKDSAVQITADIPDGMPNLRVSYRSEEGVRSLYLTESGEDGSLILLDEDSVKAVG